MAGAYTAFVVQSVIADAGRLAAGLARRSAFVVGGAARACCSRSRCIRRMYHRPLDTLLVTWGVSLMLQQLARDIFGAPNVDVRAPDWLSGRGRRSSASRSRKTRLFILALAVAVRARARRSCCKLTPAGPADPRHRAEPGPRRDVGHLDPRDRPADVLHRLRPGRRRRASRSPCSGSIGPTLGTNYIVDAFLVVVVGGIGQIKGAVIAAFALGMLQSGFEYSTTASIAKVLLFVADRRVPAGPAAGPRHGPDEEPGMSAPAGRSRRGRLLGRPRGRRRAAVRASPRRCCPTSGSTCWPSTCCFAMVAVGIGLAWGRGGMLVARPGRVLRPRRLRSWRCTSSWPTPARAACPTSWRCTATARVPGWWEPFRSPVVTLLAILLLPAARGRAARPRGLPAAGPRRVLRDPVARRSPRRSPSCSIGQQKATGGTNGLNGFHGFFGFDLVRPGEPADALLHRRGRAARHGRDRPAAHELSRYGELLVAVPRPGGAGPVPRLRPGERQDRRVRRRRRAWPAIGGALFVPIVGIISPGRRRRRAVDRVRRSASRSAGGPRCSGRCSARSRWPGRRRTLSEPFPSCWIYFQGALFILVVAFLPGGLASLRRLRRRRAARGLRRPAAAEPGPPSRLRRPPQPCASRRPTAEQVTA